MAAIKDLTGPSIMPASGEEAQSVVVFLHGLGADGNDLISLGDALANVLPGTAFYSPDAPFPCDMAPFGRQWFSLMDRDPAKVEAGIRVAAPMLDAFLDGLLDKHGLAADRLALVGFSQGTMMSLFVGPRRPEQIAGIVGFSGALVAPHALSAEKRTSPPVILVHGESDGVVPFEMMHLAGSGLTEAGIAVESHGRPGLDHGIDPDGLTLAARFLTDRLG
ncbi:MAG: alpha/beta hydrolase [Alphaproteobacteria bacterium]|nr:alpha/beta hydrolase [Alphaproteobacteria bacterium]